MTRQVRRLAVIGLLLFGALFVNLNVVQLVRGNELANHPNNRRLLIQEYQIQRGPILVGDQRVAYSVESEGNLKYLRRYEPAVEYAHLMGYYSLVYGRDGLEAALNETLTGTSSEALAQNLSELLGVRDPVGNTVRLTLDPAVQSAAYSALGDRPGAIVALDPRTGAVLAHVSRPSYDPNRLSSHDPEEVRSYWEQVQDDPGEPLADRAIERRYQPGSAMKLIVAAAALEKGIGPDTSFPDEDGYSPPGTTHVIRNFGGGTCAGGGTITFEQSLVVSCNTVFARLGVELGAETLVDQAERFGFNRRPPYTLPVAGEAVIPSDLDQPSTAMSAIGARDVQANALQMAMVVGAIANGGVLMKPYVVAEILDPSGRRLRGPQEGPWVEGSFTAQAISRETAATLADLMVMVVEEGTGRNAAIGGAQVGGKTGTADPGEELTPHAWFVGFAATSEDGGTVPRVAVAVVLPNAGEGATGGGTAAPIAKAVMEAAIGQGGE